ncbi:MAG: hypothetical protein E3J52_09605, partial [Promethearchaeota archaeon]
MVVKILLKKQKIKYYSIFVKNEHGIFKRLSRKRITPITEKVRYKQHTYFLNVSFPTYCRGLKVFYFIDVSQGQLIAEKTEIKNAQVHFKGNNKKALIDPKTLDILISKNIISQLTSNLSDNFFRTSLISVLIGAIIGGPIG